MEQKTLALILFVLTYLGIAFGSIPGLLIDRTGIAILGATAMVAAGLVTSTEAARFLDVSTILLLYGLMVLSAQLRIGGFYTRLALAVVERMRSPQGFLFQLMVISALLSAILANDIICLAFTPVVAVSMQRAGYNPLPFLLGLAISSNIGSAATIIGNPQNMLIGQTGDLDFGRFLLWCGPPSMVSLLLAYAILVGLYRRNWHLDAPRTLELAEGLWPAFNRHHVRKGLILTVLLIGLFFTPVPREISAISVAGILLCSRYITTRQVLGLVDWHLIALFTGLFIIVGVVSKFGYPAQAMVILKSRGFNIDDPFFLIAITVILSNLFSNVPAVMLLLQNVDTQNVQNLYVLALASTYAGNLITLGSIANLITIEQAAPFGIRVSFREYARAGVPVTLTSLVVILLWILVAG